jgi:hypothetical protein
MAKLYIQFYLDTGHLTKRRSIFEFSDTAFFAARDAEEIERGEKLPVNPRTDFPSFDVTDERGNEIGNG